MPVSARFGIDYPLGTEAPDVDGDLLKIVNALESLGAQFGQGTLAARPVSTPGSPGKAGRIYVVTSGTGTNELHYDYGTGWIHLNPDQALGADSITAAMLQADSVGSSEIQTDAVGSAEIAAGAVTASEIANALKPSGGAGASTEALRALGMGAALAMSQAQVVNFNMIGTLASRPAGNAVVAGTTYFATDQVVDYISDGTNWFRKSSPAGATLSWFKPDAAAPTGWVKYDGTNLPGSTGIYADLYAHLGSTLVTPNTKGRVVVGHDTGDTDWDVIGETRGAKTHTLSVTEMPSHIHDILIYAHSYNPGASPTQDFASSPLTDNGIDTGATGGGVAHNNLQPSIVAVKIAKL